MPRQMKINIDRCTQVPSIDVETLDMRHFGSSGLEAQVQAKLRKCPDDFTLRERERERVLERRSLGISYSRIGLARTRRSMSSTDYRSTCMPSGTRSNKEKDLLFSDDPAHLERTIRRGQRSTSLDATTSSSIDTHNQPSTDTRPSSSIDPNRSTTIDTTPRTSIDTVSSKMVNIIILTQDENGNLYDQDGHLRNATGQKIDAQGTQKLLELLLPESTTQDSGKQDEEMLYRELLGQQKITVDFNGKIDSAYNNLNTKIETLGTQVRKLETQVIQTGETIKTQEAFAREAGADNGKHHVNAIIDNDFWQVVRHEKLEEGDFEIESSMSLGGSQCHRSTSSAKSTECNAVRILTHEEFAAKHPHPAEPKPNPLNSLPEPVQEDQETEGRRLRKRKEKIPKNLKREANDKEMDGLNKRILRIPIEKAFDESYFTHRLWMFFREKNVTEEDIRRMSHQVREKMRHMITLSKKCDPGKFAIPCVVKGVEFSHSMCDTGASISILPRIMADHLDFHVLDIELNWNSSLLRGRSFLATIGARKIVNSVDYGKELGFIGACHCGALYESEYSESIDTHTFTSIDSNESTVTDDRNNTSCDVAQPVDHFALPNHYYPHFAFQPPSKRGHDDYSIDSWADSGFQESFAVDTVITSANEEHTEEYDEDYWKERAIEMSFQDERFETHKFTNTFPTSFDEVHSTSVGTHPRPTKELFTSIDTHTGTSIDIRAAAKIPEQENIPSPTRFIDTCLKRFAPLKPPPHQSRHTSRKDEHSSVYINRKIHEEQSSQEHKDPDGNACAIDGRILQVSREDIANILQVANGPDNLFSQQHLSCQPKGQASIDGTTQTSIDRITPTSTDKDDQTSIDRRYEFGYRAFDMYGARKFTWERRDEYGVYRDECGHARGVAGEMIPVTKDNIRKLLERASLFEESHICLPEHATSFTLTRLAPELYTKDEINEMVTGICGSQEKRGEELKSLVEDTHQPLDRCYNELFRSMAEMRTKIESLRQQLGKEATTSASIDAPHAPSIDVSLPTAQIPAEPQFSYINTRINDVYYPLNNNVDWLTKIELLQQDLDTIRKKDQQPATSIDVCTITLLDAKISAMDDRLQTYEDMHDRFGNSSSIERL
ncbi:hypothetical protein IGI04_035889 [Brassica rapa subsp. trilocularis]|uniref:Peptidase A2 domain-containing protein n=1 Tax=Brassica rapa subsp. trilocularis TaxID=1813537 RepID=A0ABQ7LFU8_BRACM|nr:hypothetical protein IGI04_035889 [Brassica rapa subsp. trilocularis]